MFLILPSTGIRSGALHTLRIRDLKKIDNIYKLTIYSGDLEEYFTFCTPETAIEIDVYLDFRKRYAEKITHDSYLIVKKFNLNLNEGSKDDSSVRQETFSKTGRSSRRPASTRDKKIL